MFVVLGHCNCFSETTLVFNQIYTEKKKQKHCSNTSGLLFSETVVYKRCEMINMITAYLTPSPRTKRPSASVLLTSTVLQDDCSNTFKWSFPLHERLD